MSLGRRHVLEGQRGLGDQRMFRLQTVLRRCLCTPGSQHITNVMTGPVASHWCGHHRGLIPREGMYVCGGVGSLGWHPGWGTRNDSLIC